MLEKKNLGILAIVFGGISLFFSWMPIINLISICFGGAGAILGIISIIINRKNKKNLAIIGTVLSISSIVIAIIIFISFTAQLERTSNYVDNVTGVKTNKKSNVLTIQYYDYSFSESKEYPLKISDHERLGAKINIDKATVYKLSKKYSYPSMHDGELKVEGFIKLHISVAASKYVSIYPTQGTAILDSGEQHYVDGIGHWDGHIASNATKDGFIIIPIKSLKSVTSLKNIRFKFLGAHINKDHYEENENHDYDFHIKL